MISIYHKVNDHFEMSNDAAILAALKTENIIWVDLLGWNEEDEKLIEKHFELEIMNTQESVEIEQSARYVEYDDHIVSHSNFVTPQGPSKVPKIGSFTVGKKFINNHARL